MQDEWASFASAGFLSEQLPSAWSTVSTLCERSLWVLSLCIADPPGGGFTVRVTSFSAFTQSPVSKHF